MTTSRDRNRRRRAVRADPRARQAQRSVSIACAGNALALAAMVVVIASGQDIWLVPLAAASVMFSVMLAAALWQRDRLLADPRRIVTLATSRMHDTMTHDLAQLGYDSVAGDVSADADGDRGDEECRDDPDEEGVPIAPRPLALPLRPYPWSAGQSAGQSAEESPVEQTRRLRPDRLVVPGHEEMVSRMTGNLPPDDSDGR